MKIKSARGRTIDFAQLLAKNENMIAIGNANMNARGDIIDKRGVVTKRREDIATEYHEANPNAVKKVAMNALQSEIMTIEDAAAYVQPPAKTRRKIVDKD